MELQRKINGIIPQNQWNDETKSMERFHKAESREQA